MKSQIEDGVILISVLVLLFAITLLVLSMLEITATETKMSRNHFDNISSLQDAESQLRKSEQILVEGKELPPSIQLISNALCGVSFYRIMSLGNKNNVKTILQSTFAVVGDVSHCDPKPNITSGRKSWRIL